MPFDVLWNGVNDGCDGDLLRDDLKIPVKMPGAAREPSRLSSRVLQALQEATDWLTTNDIMARAGMSRIRVYDAIYHLLRRGLIDRTSDFISFTKYRGERGYALKGKGFSNGETTVSGSRQGKPRAASSRW